VSQENVEIVRRAFAAAVRKPTPDFASVNALFDPDHELISLVRFRSGPGLRGAQGFREWMADADETLGEWEAKLEGLMAIDESRVLFTVTFSGQGTRSGVPVEQRMGAVATVKDGKVTRSETFPSVEEALKAVGLEE
jgi:ketosteroid isomerase-like protein